MLDFFARPVRSVLGVAEQEAAKPVGAIEHEILEAVRAIHRVADALEHQVQTVDGLAAAVPTLTRSVNNLNETMTALVTLLAPMAAAEREVQHVERFLGFRRRKHAHPSATPAAGAPPPPEPTDS
jgi:hypothetical protein